MACSASWAEAWGPGVESGHGASHQARYGDERSARNGYGSKRGSKRAWKRNWKPWELVAMIIGFVVFWPIGLAILFWKLWGGNGMCRARNESRNGNGWAGRASHFARRHDGMRRDSGNFAFEEYKAAELERLEQERRRLAEEQNAFGEFLEELKRSKDRDEFDRFMANRKGPTIDGDPAPTSSPA